jgi:hypothetical protein
VIETVRKSLAEAALGETLATHFELPIAPTENVSAGFLLQPLPIVILLDALCAVHTHVPKIFVSIGVDYQADDPLCRLSVLPNTSIMFRCVL